METQLNTKADSPPVTRGGGLDLNAYIAIARPDHWFKNVFMLLGVLLAFFIEPNTIIHGHWISVLILAVVSACLIASSNYVINEISDAPKDALHPTKRHRPVPSGRVQPFFAYAEWLALGALGLGAAWLISLPFFFSALALWVAGLLYNIPPIRTKDLPYVDVLSESINNPIRLFMGWFALVPAQVPPVSLTIAYWMAGAFFMGTKRFAEYRAIDDPEIAGRYRASFYHYNSERLLRSLLFYVSVCSFFLGIFIIRYHLELILCVPLMAWFFVAYLRVGFREDSAVQNPEKLYREHGLMLIAGICFVAFIVLLFTNIPILYHYFNVIPYQLNPLWRF